MYALTHPMSQIHTIVRCPQCGKPVPWVEAQKLKPFCSERCRMVDLGGWLDGNYAVPGESLSLEDALELMNTEEFDPDRSVS